MSSSPDTALIVPVRLPLPLERLRRAGIPDARLGLPAHASLLYPFATADSLDDALRERVADIVARHDTFTYQLASQGQWPGWLYAALEPAAPLRILQADLAAAFPDYPIYGGAFEFVPHVTIVEGAASAAPESVEARAWSSLPAWRTAASWISSSVRVIAGRSARGFCWERRRTWRARRRRRRSLAVNRSGRNWAKGVRSDRFCASVTGIEQIRAVSGKARPIGPPQGRFVHWE